MEKKFICCLCYNICDGYGNNPDGAVWKTEDGKIEIFNGSPAARCCDECNTKYVIPGRMYLMVKNRQK